MKILKDDFSIWLNSFILPSIYFLFAPSCSHDCREVKLFELKIEWNVVAEYIHVARSPYKEFGKAKVKR